MSWTAPFTFKRISRALLTDPEGSQPHLAVRTEDGDRRLSPAECRRALYRPHRDDALRPEIWRQAVSDARSEPREGPGTRTLLLVWLTLPGMNRHLYRLLDLWRLERPDLEAEAVLGVLTALSTADPDTPGVGGLLIRGGVRQMWTYASRVRKEVPVVDLGRFARARNTVPPPVARPLRSGRWRLRTVPPPRPAGLPGTLRFTEAQRRVEGERLGALAHNTGLSELVLRARRHQGGWLVGTLALGPARRPR
ncbi:MULTISPECIES: hypothetical protein [Kitasatospora]|uniref:Uncharacterized protein n=1 Tax=Kitasatospora setae (strain ATCC 33774 / DSM 43861 / JCM 3304 / KCC A-0304 / NBRC 14216 / KM-6054) TaxID=452652 RepID=E4N602_KITSK|nr:MULTISPECIES: hypothetical protein [Kitasatospora]BAJ26633.1 hypothetical protein KSE_07940 [Kitasatospora setae KM-6054]